MGPAPSSSCTPRPCPSPSATSCCGTRPRAWSNQALFWYVLILAVLTRTFITFFETPNAALAPELTRDYDQRSTIQSWRGFFGWTFGNAMTVLMFIAIFPAFVTAAIPNGQFNREAYSIYGWIASSLILGAILISSLGTHGQIAKLQPPPTRKIKLGLVFREIFDTLANKSFLSIFLTAMFAFVAAGLGSALSVYFTTYFWGFPVGADRPHHAGDLLLRNAGRRPQPSILSKRLGKKRGDHAGRGRPRSLPHGDPPAPPRRAPAGSRRGLLGRLLSARPT